MAIKRQFHKVIQYVLILFDTLKDPSEEMIKILFFVLWLVNSHDSHKVHAIHIDDMEIERQLQVINKPFVKSIQVHILLLFHSILLHVRLIFLTYFRYD